jgi:hypothetical protein
MYSWVNVQYKRDWCVEICTLRTQEEQGLAPLHSEHTLPHSPEEPIEGSVYQQPETGVDDYCHS